MDCKEVRENLVAYVDRELAGSKMGAIEVHLNGCPECEREYRKIARFTTNIVDLLEPLRPSRRFKETVLTTVTTNERKGLLLDVPGAKVSSRPWWILGAVVMAGLLAVVLAITLLMNPQYPVGVLETEWGECGILRYRSGGWIAVEGRSEVMPGERVFAGADSRSALRLEGATVTLSPSTGMQVESSADTLKLHFTAPGEVFVEANILREFRVVAQGVSVSVSRGSLNIKLRPDGQVLVSAFEGTAVLRNGDAEIGLPEGSEISLPQSGPPIGDSRKIPEGRRKWLDDIPKPPVAEGAEAQAGADAVPPEPE